MKSLIISLFMSAKVATAAVLGIRLCPTGSMFMRCQLTNETSEAIVVRDWWMQNTYSLYSQSFCDDRRVWFDAGMIGGQIPEPRPINPGQTELQTIGIDQASAYFRTTSYEHVKWRLNDLFSNEITFTIDYKENVYGPCPAGTAMETYLILHRHEEQLDNTDIGFLVLNGSNTAVTVAQPLFNDSRLVVHAPKIGYSNEVFAVDTTATNATVAARGTTEWRVPWTNLWSRLPAADRTSLTNAHEVDLYWRTGDFMSEALPLWIE